MKTQRQLWISYASFNLLSLKKIDGQYVNEDTIREFSHFHKVYNFLDYKNVLRDRKV